MSTRALRSILRPLVSVLLVWLATSVPAGAQQVVEYYAVDALGSVRVVFDATGAVTARSDYLPFGEAWAPSGNLPAQRFTGQQRDAEEGWDHFNARNLNVRLGRFNRVDPVFAGLFTPQAWNRYAYALNSPLIFVDPDGRNAQGPGEGGGCSFVTGSVVIDGKILPVDDASCVAGGSSNGGSGGNWGGALLEVFFPTAYAPSLDDSRPRGGVRVADAPVDNTAAARFGEADGNAVATGDAVIEGVQAVGSLGAKPAIKAAVKSAAKKTAVLGKFPDYVKLADDLGAKRFNVPTSVWNRMSAAEQWAANQKFLDRAIARGDDILLSNPVRNINDVTGSFRRELDYLIGNGFRLSRDGTRLIR